MKFLLLYKKSDSLELCGSRGMRKELCAIAWNVYCVQILKLVKSSIEVTNDFIHLSIYRDCLNIFYIKRNSFVIILFECKITNAMKNSREHVNDNEI